MCVIRHLGLGLDLSMGVTEAWVSQSKLSCKSTWREINGRALQTLEARDAGRQRQKEDGEEGAAENAETQDFGLESIEHEAGEKV